MPIEVYEQAVEVRTHGRGTYELTSELATILRASGLTRGTLTVFCRHTSCSLVIMENADPTARSDLETFFTELVPDGDPSFTHDTEGPDDMSAHIRMALTRTSETIPFSGGNLLLGTWQGVFLWEHRTHPHQRQLHVSLVGE
jgi:secondary thiamine-phosphate synthase enzyme